MRGIWMVLAVAGCTVGEAGEAADPPAPLRVEPTALDLTVQLDAAAPAPFRVLSGGVDVTAKATYAMTGAPLGTVDADGFHSDGRTGGRATITVSFEGVGTGLQVHVALHASRNGAAAQVPGWFASAALGVALDPPGGDDVHDVQSLGPDLDVHVYGSGAEAKLNAAEWDAIARTSR